MSHLPLPLQPLNMLHYVASRLFIIPSDGIDITRGIPVTQRILIAGGDMHLAQQLQEGRTLLFHMTLQAFLTEISSQNIKSTMYRWGGGASASP